MRMSRMPFFHRTPVAGLLFPLILAGALAGCASKNPLIDEPATAASATTANQTNASAKTAATGVTTVEPTRFERFINFLRPYRIDIQQGNFISREMVAQLRESMQHAEGVTPEQVRFALGTPLLTDVFHADRWDYIFRLKKRNGELIASRVTVFFKDGRVADIEGDQLPTEAEYLSYIAGAPVEGFESTKK